MEQEIKEKNLQLKGKIKAAMVYPLIVMAVAVVILVGLLLFVGPKFKQILQTSSRTRHFPPLTQFVLTISDAVKNHHFNPLVVSVVFGIGLKFVARTPRGIQMIGRLVIRIPLFGELFLKGIIARFGRTLGTMLAGSGPILPAMLIRRDTCGNARVARAITEVQDRAKEGSSAARPLEATQVFPPTVMGMMDVAEHTGQMPEILGKVADIYEDEVDNAGVGVGSLIEPMILFLGLMVSTIVTALFRPIVRIVQLLT